MPSIIHVGKKFVGVARQEKNWTQQGDVEVNNGVSRTVEYGADSNLFKVTVEFGGKKLISYMPAFAAPEENVLMQDMDLIDEQSEQMALALKQ